MTETLSRESLLARARTMVAPLLLPQQGQAFQHVLSLTPGPDNTSCDGEQIGSNDDTMEILPQSATTLGQMGPSKLFTLRAIIAALEGDWAVLSSSLDALEPQGLRDGEMILISPSPEHTFTGKLYPIPRQLSSAVIPPAPPGSFIQRDCSPSVPDSRRESPGIKSLDVSIEDMSRMPTPISRRPPLSVSISAGGEGDVDATQQFPLPPSGSRSQVTPLCAQSQHTLRTQQHRSHPMQVSPQQNPVFQSSTESQSPAPESRSQQDQASWEQPPLKADSSPPRSTSISSGGPSFEGQE